MPFLSRPIQPKDLIGIEDLLAVAPPEEEEIVATPTFGALFEAGQKVGLTKSYAEFIGRTVGVEEDPDFEPDWSKLHPRFDAHIDTLEGARSEFEFRSLQRRIDETNAAYQKMAGSGFKGFAADMASFVTDPINMGLMVAGGFGLVAPIRTSSAALGGGRLAYGASIGGAAMAEAGAYEALLQGVEPTREALDSTANILAAGVLGTLFGTAGAALLRKGISDQQFADLHNEVRDQITDVLRVRRAIDESSGVGAGSAVTTLAQEKPLRNPFRHFTIQSPTYRLIYDQYSATASRTADELTPHNVLKQKHLEGIAPEHTPFHSAVEQEQIASTASMIKGVKSARRSLKKRGVKMTEDQIAVAIGQAARRGDVHEHAEIAALARQFRNDVDKWTPRAVAQGLMDKADFRPDLAVSYFPRLFDLDVMSRDYNHWRALLSNHFRATDAELLEPEIEHIVASITNTIRGTPVGRLELGRYEIPAATLKSGRFKERNLDIQDVDLEPFLIDDARYVLQHYMRSVVPDVLLRERYGVDNIGNLDGVPTIISKIEAIDQEYQVAINTLADAGKDTSKVVAAKDQAQKDLQFLLAQVTGYDAPRRGILQNNKIIKMAGEVRAYAAALALQNIVLSSIPDVANVVLQHGLLNFFRTRPAAWKMGKLSASAKQDFDVMAIGMDTTMGTRMMKYADIEDQQWNRAAYRFSGHRTAGFTFKVFGANRWNRSLKRGAGVAAQNRLIADSLKYSELSSMRRAKLASAGIDEDFARAIVKNYNAQETKKFQGAHWADVKNWDSTTADRFEQILYREVDTTIVTPQPGDTPAILDNSLGKFLTQFKKTVLSMQLQILSPLFQRMAYGDVSALNALITMSSMGMLSYYLKLLVRFNFDPDAMERELDKMTTSDWLREGIDRSATLGFVTDGFNFVDNIAGGRISTSMGMSESSRYFFRGLGFGTVAPAFGYVERGMRLGGAVLGEQPFTANDLHTLRLMTPLQNSFYTKWLFDMAERNLAQSLKLPKGKRRRRRYAKRSVKL